MRKYNVWLEWPMTLSYLSQSHVIILIVETTPKTDAFNEINSCWLIIRLVGSYGITL